MSDPKSIPDTNTVSEASELEVLDIKGDKVKFGSLFEKEKTVVVFIRHFFCGACQAYVENIARVPKEALEAVSTRIVVIGCGEWNPIEAYHDTTGFQGPIYADPSRSLYRALGLIENLHGTPSGQAKPSYLAHLSTFSNIVGSIWRGPLKHPGLIGKQGNITQLGGDFIFGPGKECALAYRMQNTEDHLSVVELMKAAGVDYSE